MRALKLLGLAAVVATFSGCAVYGPPPPAAYYQPAPAPYYAPAPAYYGPTVGVGIGVYGGSGYYGRGYGGRRWR